MQTREPSEPGSTARIADCPAREQLRQLLEESEPSDSISDHVESCPACQAVLDELTALGEPPVPGGSIQANRLLTDDDFRRMSGYLSLCGAFTPSHTMEPAWPAIPQYDILRELGRGGMAIVYEAHHHGLDRRVAIKAIRGEASREAIVRFCAEARTIAALQHPHIVQVFEVGVHAKHPYIALELMTGGTLADATAGKPVPPRVAAGIVLTIASATHYAHCRGVLHRDLKPSNVLLDAMSPTPAADADPLENRMLKISDFGLAKQLGEDPGITYGGGIVGTPHYLSPEQARSEHDKITVATDVYGIGATFYELLTGRPPFGETGQSAHTIVHRVATESPVAPARLVRQLPRDLETICLKCLEKEPDRRYASAAALAEDLRRFLAGLPILGRPIGPVEHAVRLIKRRPVVAALTAAFLLTLLGGAITSTFFAVQANHRAERARLAEMSRARQSAELLLDRAENLAANGEVTAALPEMLSALQTSPDPHFQQIARIDIVSWLQHAPELQKWFPAPVRSFPSLSGDGKTLAIAGKKSADASDEKIQLQFWDVDAGRPLAPGILTPDSTIGPIAFSHSGRLLLTGNGNAQKNQYRPGWANLWDVRQRKQIGSVHTQNAPVMQTIWLPDDRQFITVAADGAVQMWSVDSLAQADGQMQACGMPDASALSPDGQWLVVAAGSRLQACDLVHQSIHDLPSPGSSQICGLCFSSKGDWLLWVNRTSGTRGYELHRQRWDPSTPGLSGEQITSKYPSAYIHMNTDGTFSPEAVTTADGSRYARITNGVQIWHAPPSAQLQVKYDSDHGQSALDPKLAFGTRFDSAAVAAWRICSNGNAVEMVDPATGAGIGQPLPRDSDERFTVTASPDGQRVALVVPKSPTMPVAVLAQLYDPHTGQAVGKPLQMTNTIISMAFSPDSRLIATGGHDQSVQLWSASDGHPIGHTMQQNDMVSRICFSRDGKTLIVSTWGHAVQVWDVATQTPRLPALMHDHPVWDCAINSDSSRIAGATQYGLALWNASDGSLINNISFDDNPNDISVAFPAIRFSDDGKLLLWTDSSGLAKLVDAVTGHLLGSLERPDHALIPAIFRFFPDTMHLLAGYEDGLVQTWDIATLRPLGATFQSPGRITDIRFHTETQSIQVLGADGISRSFTGMFNSELSPERIKHISEQPFAMTQTSNDVSRLATPYAPNTHGQGK